MAKSTKPKIPLHTSARQCFADSVLLECVVVSTFKKNRTFFRAVRNNYLTWLSQYILICQCLVDQLFASAFRFGE